MSLGLGMQKVANQILTMGGQKTTVVVRTLGSPDTPYDDPAITTKNVTYTAIGPLPTMQRNIQIPEGYYVDDFQDFYFPSTVSIHSSDRVLVPATGDEWVVLTEPQWFWAGVNVFTRVTVRRQRPS